MFRAALQKTKIRLFTKHSLRSFSKDSSITNKNSSEIELTQLRDSWKNVVTPDLLAFTRTIDADGIGTEWYNRVLQHTVPRGEPIVGLTAASTYKLLADQPRPEDTKLAHILAWCGEMVNAASQVHDDIADQGTTRRGVPAWYTLKDVGPAAIHDGLLVSRGCYHILEKYFSDKDFYSGLVTDFLSTEFHAAFSVSLELRIQKQNVLTFTEKHRNTIVITKSWISYLPFACAMHLTGYRDPEVFQKVREIAMMGAFLYQVQDDFIDVYGDPGVTGKVGTDIQTNTCTWFSQTANRLASERQRNILGECYGSSNPKKVEQVMQLFDELCLLERYKEHEAELYEGVLKAIQSSSLGRIEVPLLYTLNKLNQRVK